MPFVSSSEIEHVRTKLEALWATKEPRRIPSTHEVHFVKDASATRLDVAVVSPFLLVMKSSANPDDTVPLRSVQIFDPKASTGYTVPCSSNISTINVETGKYFAVDYISRFYIGRGFRHMKFLHQYSRNGKVWFQWPRAADCDDVHHSAIFFGPVTTLEGVDEFSIAQLSDINAVFAELKHQK